ncbi:MAG TPA: site-specific integrase [Syntrophorhabdus sp.]|nr:site-specific integrase [Syntrophorhabdus sp.]HQO64130.1 site-specific integrase [Syntrophorhabdus sp.]
MGDAKRQRTKLQGVYERESEGRLFQGKPDKCFDITYKVNGRKIWEKVGWLSEGYSQKMASHIRAERLRSIRHGQDLPQEKKQTPYFRDIAKKYLEWAEQNHSRAGQDDKSMYENHLRGFDDKRLNAITSFTLEKFKADLIKKNLAPASVKNILASIRQIFNKAILWSMYDGSNPVKGVKMPTLQNERQRFLSFEEATLLMETLKANKRHVNVHDMALLALHCGLRASEIFSLRGRDLDFKNGIITIANPKNKTTRHAYMTDAVREMLTVRNPETPDTFVFRDRNGNPVKDVSNAFQRVVDSLKLNDGIEDPRYKIVFHSLRHTFASWLALQGESLLTIKELMGHKTLSMVQRYAHLSPDHKRTATLSLEKAFMENKGRGTLSTEEKS